MRKFQIVLTALDKISPALTNVNKKLQKVANATRGVRRAFASMASKAGKGLRSVGSFASGVVKKLGLLGLAGAGAFGLVVRSSLNATDALGKTARKIGTTAGDLAKLRYAADLTGVSTQTMDMALQRFTRRTAEAARGTGEAKGALRELEIDARQLLKLPLAEQMTVLADAFEGVKNPADKVRIAMKLFDSEGVALVNTLGLGKDALIEMMGEAEGLGIVLSQEAVQGVEDANDSITRLRTLIRGFRDQTIAKLAPALQTVIDKFVNLGKEAAGGDFENIGTVIANKIIEGFRAIVIVFQDLLNNMGEIAHQIKRIYRNIFSSEETRKNEAELERLMTSARKAGINVTKALDPNKLSGNMARGVDTYLDSLSEEQRNILTQINRITNELNQIENRETSAYEPFDFSGLLNDLADVQNEIGKTSEKTNNLNNNLNNLGVGNLSIAERAFKSFSDTIEPIDKQLEDIAVGAMNSFTDSVAGAITGAKNFKESMKQMAKGVIESLTKMLVQYYITKPLFDMITGYIGNITGAGQVTQPQMTYSTGQTYGSSVDTGFSYTPPDFGSNVTIPDFNLSAPSNLGSTVDMSGFKLNLEGGGYTGYGARSGGIDGKGGFPAILHPNESVIDHTKPDGRATSNSGDSIVINQTINVSTGVAQTVRAEISNLMPQIQETTKAAVADSRARGGSYSKALLGA